MKTLLVLCFIFCSTVALAADQKPKAPVKTNSSSPAASASNSKRGTTLSFEDDVVENLNNPLLDSLDSTRGRNTNLDGVLYLKRIEYKREIKQNLRELRYLQ